MAAVLASTQACSQLDGHTFALVNEQVKPVYVYHREFREHASMSFSPALLLSDERWAVFGTR
jgi:hypothetical protein